MDGVSFDCASCGQRHAGLPALVYDTPAIGSDESGNPQSIKKIAEDFCILDGQHYLVRTVLAIPIVGGKQTLDWGVWGSVSEANFQRYRESFDSEDQASIGGMFSYLGNELGGYPGSLALRCNLLPQNGRRRPILEPQTGQDHLLVREWRNGITPERAIALAMPFLHPQGHA